MATKLNINANGVQVEVRYCGVEGDFISLTDIAKYRTAENPGYVIQNWMRNRNTVRFLACVGCGYDFLSTKSIMTLRVSTFLKASAEIHYSFS